MIDGRDGGENGEMDFDSISCVWRNYISLLSTSERKKEREKEGWREGRLASISWFNVHFLFICSPFPPFFSKIKYLKLRNVIQFISRSVSFSHMRLLSPVTL